MLHKWFWLAAYCSMMQPYSHGCRVIWWASNRWFIWCNKSRRGCRNWWFSSVCSFRAPISIRDVCFHILVALMGCSGFGQSWTDCFRLCCWCLHKCLNPFSFTPANHHPHTKLSFIAAAWAPCPTSGGHYRWQAYIVQPRLLSQIQIQDK